jgi:hypothetical protein
MSNLTTTDVTEKRISLVYNSDITGFQPIDFSKIDGIESLLTSGISVTANVPFASTTATYPSQIVALGFQDTINTGNILPVGNDANGLPIKIDTIRVQGVPETYLPVWLNGNANNDVPIAGTVTASISGTVTTIQQKKSNISNFTPSGTNGIVLQANANREELFIQNLQSGNLYVKYGTSGNSNSFNFILASSTVSGGGDGGSLSDLNYTGVVSVSGLNSSYICWERS